MKGISLAIETIIFIILAVTVLSVLLLFFTKTGGESQSLVELQAKRDIYCGTYVQADPQCNRGGTDANGKEIFSASDKEKFRNVCSKLSVNTCGSASQDCFADCCKLFCIR